MQYPLPQFIEREPRIVGPLTFRQAIFLGAAGGLILLVRAVLPPGLAWIMIILLAATGASLAFVKIGGRPLPAVLTAAFQFITSPRRYLWEKEQIKVDFPVISSSPKIIKKAGPSEDDRALMRLASSSRLEKLKSKIETKK